MSDEVVELIAMFGKDNGARDHLEERAQERLGGEAIPFGARAQNTRKDFIRIGNLGLDCGEVVIVGLYFGYSSGQSDNIGTCIRHLLTSGVQEFPTRYRTSAAREV